MGEIGPVACVGFLGGGTGIFFPVAGAEFFPSDEQGCVIFNQKIILRYRRNVT